MAAFYFEAAYFYLYYCDDDVKAEELASRAYRTSKDFDERARYERSYSAKAGL